MREAKPVRSTSTSVDPFQERLLGSGAARSRRSPTADGFSLGELLCELHFSSQNAPVTGLTRSTIVKEHHPARNTSAVRTLYR